MRLTYWFSSRGVGFDRPSTACGRLGGELCGSLLRDPAGPGRGSPPSSHASRSWVAGGLESDLSARSGHWIRPHTLWVPVVLLRRPRMPRPACWRAPFRCQRTCAIALLLCLPSLLAEFFAALLATGPRRWNTLVGAIERELPRLPEYGLTASGKTVTTCCSPERGRSWKRRGRGHPGVGCSSQRRGPRGPAAEVPLDRASEDDKEAAEGCMLRAQ